MPRFADSAGSLKSTGGMDQSVRSFDVVACEATWVNDDEIRALLASVQPSRWIDRTADTVAILRSRVEEAGGDPDAVAEWVKARGGQVARTPPYRPPCA